MPGYDDTFPVSDSSVDTPRATAGIVIGALVALWLLRKGFRGISVGGVSANIR
jgi:hypothetical protein